MNTASTLIAIVPEADLATVTGGVDWAVSPACWVAATFVDAFYPGLGALITLSCMTPIT